MALLSVVEVASLTGLVPDEVRALIRMGLLEARSIRLDAGESYLVNSEQVDQLRRAVPSAAARLGCGAPPSSTDELLEALLGLRAALARRRSRRNVVADEDESPSPTPRLQPPTRRPAVGLSPDELRSLRACIDRLSQPVAATLRTVSPR